jgi:hypothetical protein
MKKFLLILLTAMALAPAAMATDFTFAQAGVKINLPDAFALLPRADIDQLYMPTRGPGFVIGNATRSVTISYDLKAHNLASLNLGQALKVFEQIFEQRVPGLVWKERKLMEHEKQQWLQLEFLSKTGGIEYYNIMLITPIKDQMLVLNLNSTVAEFPQAEPQLRAVMKSIALNVEVPQMVTNPAPAKKPAQVKKKEKAAG